MFKGGLKLFKLMSAKSIKPGLQKDRLAENISRENGRKSIDDSAFKIHVRDVRKKVEGRVST